MNRRIPLSDQTDLFFYISDDFPYPKLSFPFSRIITAIPNVSCMHGLWSIALQYTTIQYTLCEPSIVIKKGIFRLCSLETKNSAVPLCFRIPNPALRRVTCAIRTLLMPSASQNLLPDALSAQTCGDCSQPMGIPSLAPSICILFPFHAFSNLFISAISQMLRLWRFATSRSTCTTIIRIKNFLLFVKGCRCFCSACAE